MGEIDGQKLIDKLRQKLADKEYQIAILEVKLEEAYEKIEQSEGE